MSSKFSMMALYDQLKQCRIAPPCTVSCARSEASASAVFGRSAVGSRLRIITSARSAANSFRFIRTSSFENPFSLYMFYHFSAQMQEKRRLSRGESSGSVCRLRISKSRTARSVCSSACRRNSRFVRAWRRSRSSRRSRPQSPRSWRSARPVCAVRRCRSPVRRRRPAAR